MATTKDSPDLHLDFVEIVEPRLFMSTSYQNTYINSTPTGVIDVSNPGSGWFDCGSISAVRIPLTKEAFELMKGVPKTSRKYWELSRTAQITFNTSDLTPYVEALIMGQTLFNTMGSLLASSEQVASLMDDGSRRRKYIKLTKPVDPAFQQYDIVACASNTSASLKDSYNIAVVESLVASVVTLEGAGFPVDTVIGDTIAKIRSIEFIDALGTDTIRSALLFWDTMVSASTPRIQHCLYLPKLRNFAGGDMDMKDAAEPYDTGITLTAAAVNMTYGDGTSGYNFYKKWVLQY